MPSLKRHDSELSPAARYYLVCGLHPNNHYCGAASHQAWHCQVDVSLTRCVGLRPIPGSMPLLFMEPRELEDVWLAYRGELIAEATAYGFQPAACSWFDTGAEPLDTPIDLALTAQWRRTFVSAYVDNNRER